MQRALATVIVFALLGGATILPAFAETDVTIPKKFGALAERVKEYYRLEEEQKWGQTWKFRVPLYRKSVPQDTYVREMQKGSRGWRLNSFHIRNVSEDGPCVLLTITFVETPPKDYLSAQGLPAMSEISIEDDSRWEKIDGAWQAWETGSRMHLPLNSAVVAPNQSLQGRTSTCGGRSP